MKPALSACLICLLGSPPALLAGDIANGLTTSQLSTLKKGDQILITEDVAGKPWPRVTIYQVVSASAEEVAAVFFDYENNKSFVPKLLKSEISKKIAPCTMEIDYAVDVPVLPDEFYTVRNTIQMLAPGRYRIDWKLVRAVQTKDSVGSFRVEDFENKAIICYQNLVTPSSSMAGLLRKTAISQMRDAATAIATRAEKLKASDPALLAREVESLRAALGQ